VTPPDDMIVSGGENVFPLEIEQVLPVPPRHRRRRSGRRADAEFGQRLAAFVVPKLGSPIDADGVRSIVAAGWRATRSPDVSFVDELPRNTTGKLLRGEVAGRRRVSAA